MNDNPFSLMFIDAPELSDEAAAQMLSFLNEFTNAVIGQYYPELCRYYQTHETPLAYDWVPVLDDDWPDFKPS
jgi:hypothetical protein